MIAGFIGKMGCFVKGTMIKTLQGDKPIEKVDTVLSYDFKGNVVSVPCGVVKTSKVPYEIVFDDGSSVVCSEEHPFFVEDFKTVMTKDLKIGTRIQYFQDERTTRKEKPYVEGSRREKNNQTLQEGREHNENMHDNRSFSNARNEKASNEQHNYSSSQRTNSSDKGQIILQRSEEKMRFERRIKSFLRTREIGGSEKESCRLLVDSETQSQVGVLLMPSKEHEQEIRFSCASQGLRQHEQLSRQFGCFVPTVSRQSPLLQIKVESIRRIANEEVEMYDLIVPNTNNFILSNGVLTHNSGKTLSMVREVLKYYLKGYKIYSNFHINIPYTPLDFDDLFKMAENQEPLKDVIILLDEIHIVLDSRSGMSKNSKIITFWLNQTRKMKVKLFYTTQYLHQVDKRLRSGTDFIVYCEGMKYIKEGVTHFICCNSITDRDSVKEEYFLADKYFKFYDTDEVISFIKGGAET